MENLPKTDLAYLHDSYKFEDEAKVVAIDTTPEGKTFVILDKTIFYPQGGGQPYDKGTIATEDNVFTVNEVRFKDGFVYHIGEFTSVTFPIGASVKLLIDEERRKLHCRLHSGGHLVDTGIHALGYDLTAVKGYHFPDGPYIEYIGVLNGDLTVIAQQLETKLNDLIQAGYPVRTEIVNSVDDLKGRCFHIPEYLPKDKPIRLVFVCGEIGEPCGGTHVKDLREVGKIRIPKIKTKGENLRISYIVE